MEDEGYKSKSYLDTSAPGYGDRAGLDFFHSSRSLVWTPTALQPLCRSEGGARVVGADDLQTMTAVYNMFYKLLEPMHN